MPPLPVLEVLERAMKTHRERAGVAANRVSPRREMGAAVDAIAEETYPTELIGAARSAATCVNKNPGPCRRCRHRLDAALALYLEHP
jgi:hypothetical protein